MSSRRQKAIEARRQAREARLIAAARSGAEQLEPMELCRLAKSPLGNVRAFALIQMTDLVVSKGTLNAEFLHLAGSRLCDPDLVARDFAMHVVSSFAEGYPQLVWPYLSLAVTSIGREGREFLGVTVLEELLEHHFEETLSLLKRDVLRGNRGWLDSLSMTWFDNNSGPDYATVQQYLAAQGYRSRVAV